MKVTIGKLIFQNFKGLKDLTVDFNREGITNIYGENASGKSSIFDGFTYLFTEKDSLDRKAFEIKTLDKNNKPIHRQTHSVTGEIYQDDFKTILKREYLEKWQKKRGEPEPTFTGHETNHFVDSIPVTKKEYQEVIDKIMNESVLKLLSNPFHFANKKWEDKRSIVLQVAGEPSIEDVAKGVKKYEDLLKLIDTTDFELWRRKTKAHIADIKKEKAKIPPKIEELQSYTGEQFDRSRLVADRDLVEEEINAVSMKIQSKQNQLKDRHEKLKAMQKKHSDMLREIELAKNKEMSEGYSKSSELKQRISELKSEKQQLLNEKEMQEVSLAHANDRLAELQKRKADLLASYKELNAKTFQIKPDDKTCYACGQELPDAEALIAEKEEAFKKEKQTALAEIKEKGTKVAEEIAAVQSKIKEISGKIEPIVNTKDLDGIIEKLNKEVAEIDSQEQSYKPSQSILDMEAKAKETEEKIELFETQQDNATDELTARYHELDNRRTEIIEKIAECKKFEEREQRVIELQQEEARYGYEQAKLEKLEFDADGLVKRKITMMEKDIKEKFNGVQFKMYNELINGGEEPTCQILIDGVPFDNANHAAQINTGVKIINALSEHYSVKAPIFVDNAEAVNVIEPTDSQLIRLVVVEPGFKTDNGILLKPIK